MLLLLKLLLVPALVASVTLAGRRWGLRTGGVLTALPMVAGPTLCFYAIEQGHAFAASAARATLLGIAAIAAFCVGYARSAAHAKWIVSVLAGWSAFAAIGAVVYRVPDLHGVGELALAIAALVTAERLLPRPGVLQPAARPPRWDIPLRMTTAAVSVVLLTALAQILGARLSGILSAFPVVTVILAVFTHVQLGHASVAVFLRGMLRGLHSFALFCIVFATVLGPLRWPLPAAVTAALMAQLALQAVIVWRVSRQASRQPAAAVETKRPLPPKPAGASSPAVPPR